MSLETDLSEVDVLVQKFVNKYFDEDAEKFCGAQAWDLHNTSGTALRGISSELPYFMRLFMRMQDEL